MNVKHRMEALMTTIRFHITLTQLQTNTAEAFKARMEGSPRTWLQIVEGAVVGISCERGSMYAEVYAVPVSENGAL